MARKAPRKKIIALRSHQSPIPIVREILRILNSKEHWTKKTMLKSLKILCFFHITKMKSKRLVAQERPRIAYSMGLAIFLCS